MITVTHGALYDAALITKIDETDTGEIEIKEFQVAARAESPRIAKVSSNRRCV